MSRFTRAKKIDRAAVMQRMIQQNQLSPDGADWLTLRLDPYHDFQRPVAGYPDADAYDTVVSNLNYEYNVSKPAGSAGNWDAHIFTLPTTGTVCDLGNSVNAQFTQTAVAYELGIVNIAKDDTGGPLFPSAVPVASANFSMTKLSTFEGVEAGLSRVIGMGIEIIDTTAEMYKQGAVTCYRVPSGMEQKTRVGFVNTGGTMQAITDPTMIQAPPSSVAQAVLYRGSVQWEAREGAYMVVGQQGVNNPFVLSAREDVLVNNDATLTGTDVSLHSQLTALTPVQVPPLITATTPTFPTKKVNVTQSGIMITGLANSATFKIRVRVYVERAPLRSESDLIPLATPSATLDSKALELYAALVTELPVAVPVCFNAKGDWWRWIIRTVAKVAPIIGQITTPFIGPEAAVIGNLVGQGAQAISNATQRKQTKDKKKPIMVRNKK